MVSRMVFMVIDAIRTEFVQNQQNAAMNYLSKVISGGKACVEPTVTMPRIEIIPF